LDLNIISEDIVLKENMENAPNLTDLGDVYFSKYAAIQTDIMLD